MKKNGFVGRKQVMNRNRSTQVSDSGIGIVEVHQIFVTAKKAEGLRERTIHDHKTHFMYFIKWLSLQKNENFKVHELDVLLIREYIGFMQDKGLSPVTINVRLRTLRSFLKFMHDEGYITANLATKVKILKTDEDTIKIMSDDQVQAFLKVIDKKTYTGFRDYVAIALMIDTGMRISEIGSLTKEQIDFENYTIYLPPEKVKNRRGRNIPLSPKVNKVLYQLVTENSVAFNVEEVFLSVYGTPFQPGSFRKRLVTYKNKAGIKGARVSPHSFRHYFAKNYILNGGDPFTLQLILGHADMQIVRRYIQMNSSDIKTKHNQFSPFQRFNL